LPTPEERPPLLRGVPASPRKPSRWARALAVQGGVIFWLIGLSLIPATIPGLLATYEGPVELAISLSPQPAAGEVSGLTEVQGEDGPTGKTAIRYRYFVGGADYEGGFETDDQALISAAFPRESLSLEVSGLYAGWSRIAGVPRGSTLELVFFLLCLLIPAALIAIGLRRRRLGLRALIYGVSAVGRCLSFEENKEAEANPYELTWELEVGGKKYRKTLSISASYHKAFSPGPMAVVYEPGRERHNVPYLD
jgi:hypothetical protein